MSLSKGGVDILQGLDKAETGGGSGDPIMRKPRITLLDGRKKYSRWREEFRGRGGAAFDFNRPGPQGAGARRGSAGAPGGCGPGRYLVVFVSKPISSFRRYQRGGGVHPVFFSIQAPQPRHWQY
jgi:hypothetical protein